MSSLEQIVETVLYEGYLLWPYRRSAQKNQQRWTFGGVYPRRYSEARGEDDPWLMQTECLVQGAAPQVDVCVRFLHLVQRDVARERDGGREWVEELVVNGTRYLSWEEAAEREVWLRGLSLKEMGEPETRRISIPAGTAQEALYEQDGRAAGVIVRRWRNVEGELTVSARPVADGLFRLRVRITNETPWQGQSRPETLHHTLLSTHTILQVRDGEFLSLMDPPPEWRAEAEACENIKTWPVLAGEADSGQTMLSSPIILYDYPQVAPESLGNLYDSTEIDQLLLLNLLTLTEEEKAEIRATDPRAKALLERSEALTADDFMQLHGAIREFRTLGRNDLPTLLEELERPGPQTVTVDGAELGKGSRVRLRPKAGGDVMDLALAGRIAILADIEQDYEGRVHLVCVLEDDPGRELGLAKMPGHRFFFSPQEVEPVDE